MTQQVVSNDISYLSKSTNVEVINDNIQYDSSFVKSIRHDYNDVPSFQSWTKNNLTCTRLECTDIKFNMLNKPNSFSIKYIGNVSKIKLLNLPYGIYTLNINGHNVMSSKNMVFDIINTHTTTLDNFIQYAKKEDNVINVDNKHIRYLQLTEYDVVTISFNHNIKNIEDIIYLETHMYNEITQHKIYKHTYKLQLSCPTEYITIILNDDDIKKDNIFLTLKICNRIIIYIKDIKDIKSNRIVVKFKRNHTLDTPDGNEDEHIKTCLNIDNTSIYDSTIYFSRINDVYLETNSKIKSIHSSFYKTYYVPNSDTNIDVLSPLYCYFY